MGIEPDDRRLRVPSGDLGKCGDAGCAPTSTEHQPIVPIKASPDDLGQLFQVGHRVSELNLPSPRDHGGGGPDQARSLADERADCFAKQARALHRPVVSIAGSALK